MHAAATLTIEGPHADRALAEFLAIPGIDGAEQPDGREVFRDPAVLAVVGSLVGIAGGLAGIVSSILDWRGRWLAARDGRRLRVVLHDAHGNRLELADATPEQITQALRTFAR